MKESDDFKAFYDAVLKVITALAEIDPPADSPEGRLLITLAAALETYEKGEQ